MEKCACAKEIPLFSVIEGMEEREAAESAIGERKERRENAAFIGVEVGTDLLRRVYFLQNSVDMYFVLLRDIVI